MNRLEPPTIIDSPAFRFPSENQTTGQSLREVFRKVDSHFVRCRMRDLKEGDLFVVRSRDPDFEHHDKLMIAETDAWFLPSQQDWGVTANYFEDQS